jgi:hypothetical protein
MPELAESVQLSETAVANLRFRIKGFPLREQDLPAYRELVAAGIAEPASGPEYRFTAWGMEHREEILERESDRIERERHEPPDRNISEAATGMLRRIASGERVEVDVATRPVFRELAAARIVTLGHSFAGGNESCYRFTYWGWKLRAELIARAKRAV